MIKLLSACLLFAFALLAFGPLAVAQQSKKPRSPAENRFNRGTVSLIAGDVHSTTIRMSGDLEVVLSDGDNLRIVPVAGKGSLQNLLDVLYLEGIDIGLVQADVLEHAKSKQVHPDLEGAIRYVAKLHNEELHLLVREDIESFTDLADKPVSIGPPGSGSFITASALFAALETPIRALNLDLDLALEQLKSGEIAGLAYVAGKPARVFAQLSEKDGVKLLSVPRARQLWQSYLPAKFTEADYPGLVPAGQSIETKSGRPLLNGRWAAGVDTVGGEILATTIKSLDSNAVVTCCGNVASQDLPINVFPFILRGVTLVGIDSQNCSMQLRQKTWQKLASDWKIPKMEQVVAEIALDDLDQRIEMMLTGKHRGRAIVKMTE